MSRYRICHFSSVHQANDTRIYLKECRAAVEAGYDTVFVATGCENSVKDGIKTIGVTLNSKGRLSRMLLTSWKVYKKALEQDADIYQFHDPELFPYGLLLRFKGKQVIYDVHEDVPDDILVKEWIYPIIRKFVSNCFRIFENWVSKKMSYVVVATPFIGKRFQSIGCNSIVVNNYPIKNELCLVSASTGIKENAVCFVGGISDLRGASEMIIAIGKTDCTLKLAGEFSPPELRDKMKSHSGWIKVFEYGQKSREDVAAIMAESFAGLILYHPGPNHTNSQPNKLFEYMSASLPVIASNFPLWKEIVEGNKCGICVDPLNSDAIAEAIIWMRDHPEEARQMGNNGRKAVLDRYNWEQESKKLIALYKEII